MDDAVRMNETADEFGVKLMAGHTHSFDPPITRMREVVKSGELGKLLMSHAAYYKDHIYRPFPHHDMLMSRGVVLNQGPHQVDIVRLLGGGRVRSVRAMSGVGDPSRLGEGHYVAYLEFEDGTPATVIKNGYGGFSASEFLPFMQEPGRSRQSLNQRKSLRLGQAVDEEAGKEAMRFGGGREAELSSRAEGGGGSGFQMDAGIIIACCEKGDIRQSPEGLWVYDDDGQREVPVEGLRDERMAELDEMHQAVTQNRPVHHDGRWGMATLEVILAMLQSSREHREVELHHQVPAWE
jgi:predicted dehydrogenase